MNRNYLTLKDLKRLGLNLSKAEAMELQPIINRISQHGAEDNEVFPADHDIDLSQLDKVFEEPEEELDEDYDEDNFVGSDLYERRKAALLGAGWEYHVEDKGFSNDTLFIDDADVSDADDVEFSDLTGIINDQDNLLASKNDAPADTKEEPIDPEARLSPEENTEVFAYLGLTDNTREEYRDAIVAFLNDPTQGITDLRRVQLNNKIKDINLAIAEDNEHLPAGGNEAPTDELNGEDTGTGPADEPAASEQPAAEAPLSPTGKGGKRGTKNV